MKSALPPIEEVKAHNTMKMVRVRLSELPYHSGTFKFDGVDKESGVRFPLIAPIYEIGDHIARGYLPSKAWWRSEDDDVHFLFYVQESMPPETRPFGTGKSYISAMYIGEDTVIEYEVGLHIFIDQVQTQTGTLYVFMFGEKEYKNVVMDSEIIGDLEGVQMEEDNRYCEDIFDLYRSNDDNT